MNRIILLGATGYQGRLTARALLARGLRPTLAGRNEAYLQALSEDLGGLPHAVADASDGAALRALLTPGDVLVTTVGPFQRFGVGVLAAAIDSGAHYLDSCGESAFYRAVHERHRDAVEAAGIVALSACAYDFFPGNVLADHVLCQAGPSAVRVDIGYLGSLAPGYRMSSGSLASGTASMLSPGLFLRGGRLVPELMGQRLGRVELDGVSHLGLSIAGTEALLLPALHPQLRDIQGYWCWGGKQTRAIHAAMRVCQGVGRHPRAYRALSGWLERERPSDGLGPSDNLRQRSSAYVTAVAYDAEGTRLASAELGDIDGFTFTANILAWSAARLLREGPQATGWTGPVQAFGREAAMAGHAECGMALRGERAASVGPGSASRASGQTTEVAGVHR